MDAEQRGIAGERTRWRLRIAGGQPGKAGKRPGTRAFGKHPQAGEEQAASPPAGNGEANEQRPGQCREDRQNKAEEHCREARHGCRHAAKNAQADIDPRDAGQKQAKAIGGGDAAPRQAAGCAPPSISVQSSANRPPRLSQLTGNQPSGAKPTTPVAPRQAAPKLRQYLALFSRIARLWRFETTSV
jgi:hypothetical protein